jgi:hypothetical protein
VSICSEFSHFLHRERGSYLIYLNIRIPNLQKKKKGGGELPYDCAQSYTCCVYILHTEDTEGGLSYMWVNIVCYIMSIYYLHCEIPCTGNIIASCHLPMLMSK